MRRTLLFLDEDHVLDLARLLLGDPATARTAAAAFLAPERPPPARLAAMAAGLQRGDEVCATVAAPGAADFAAQLETADVIVFRRGTVPPRIFRASPRLRLVQRLGVRSDMIALDAAAASGVHVSCLPRRTIVYTAEHAIMLMLAVAKQLLPAVAAMRGPHGGEHEQTSVAYNWANLTSIGGLNGRTLGLIGLGEVASLVAVRARAFGMTVLYHQRQRLPATTEERLGVGYRPLMTLLGESDIVSVHVNSSPAALGLIGRRELAAMRPGAILINTSRGALVDEAALLAALTGGRLAGAGLDVHAVEPRPPGDSLLTLPNVVLTPHVAGGSRLAVLDEIESMYENIRAALDGRLPPHGLVTEGTAHA